MDSPPIYHSWTPITDLSDVDLDARNIELATLIAVWEDRRYEFDERQVEDF